MNSQKAPTLLEALKEALFALESARNLQGLNQLTPYIDRAKAAIDAAEKQEA